MNRQLIIRAKAKEDIADAATWYARRREGLGDEFLDAVRQKIQDISAQPRIFPVVTKNDIRRALVGRFPYAIYFTETSIAIVVLAVFHTSRDQERLLRRRF